MEGAFRRFSATECGVSLDSAAFWNRRILAVCSVAEETEKTLFLDAVAFCLVFQRVASAVLLLCKIRLSDYAAGDYVFGLSALSDGGGNRNGGKETAPVEKLLIYERNIVKIKEKESEHEKTCRR